MDGMDLAKQRRDHAEIDAEIEAARTPEERAATAAIVERQRKQDQAYKDEETARIAALGRWTPWLMDDWKYQG